MKNITKSLIVIGAVAAIAIGGTIAYFSDTETSTTNTFTAGTLSLKQAGLIDTAPITIPNMAPGDVSGEYSVTIKNDGNINLAWLGDWQFTGSSALMDALYIDSAKMEFLSPNSADWNSDSTAGYESDGADIFIENGVGHGPYASFYNGIATQSSFGVVTFNKFSLPGNSGMLPGTVYEHLGALKPGYSYKLTVKFGMVAGAGNEYQALGPVTAKLKVDAAQIIPAALAPLASTLTDVAWLNAQIADQTE